LASEATYPDSVSEQEVIERPMDGLKKSAYVTLSLLVREYGAGIVYSYIHPAVIAGHRASVVDRIHGSIFHLHSAAQLGAAPHRRPVAVLPEAEQTRLGSSFPDC
jgi:hypothetical protein